MDFRKKINYWITALVIALFGILFIVIGASDNNQDVIRTLDIIIGVLFLIEGSVAILISILVKKRFVTPLSLSGAVSLSLGIYCLVTNGFITGLLALFLDYVPYLLLVLGCLLLLQAFLTFFLSKKKNMPLFVIQLVYGAIILTFGILGLTVFKDVDTKFIILGVIMCVFATYIIVASFIPAALILASVEVAESNNEDLDEVEVIEENENTDNNVEETESNDSNDNE